MRRKSEKKIPPADAGGYIQGIRLSLAEQDNHHVPKSPPEGKQGRKPFYVKVKEKTIASGVNRLAGANSYDSTPAVTRLEKGNSDREDIRTFPTTNNLLKSLGPAVSEEPNRSMLPATPRNTSVSLITPTDFRGVTPSDLLTVNTTAMGESARRLIYPDEDWLTRETHTTPLFPAEPIISPQMEAVDRRCTRSKVPIPEEILPVAKHRILRSLPESTSDQPTDVWVLNTLGGN